MRHWRLSGFYFFYFAALGALVPYWSLYLRSIGFGATRIGLLMALPMVSRVIAPNVWGWIADARGEGTLVTRTAALAALMCYSGVFFTKGFTGVALVMAAFTFFWYASLPQLEIATLLMLGTDYGKVRLWGSVGFIVSVAGLGLALDRLGIRALPLALFAMLSGVALFSFCVRHPAMHEPEPLRTSFLRAVMKKPVFAFLLACFLMQASHAPYYTFYSIDLVRHGYSKAEVGMLWAFAVLCEIGIFMWGRRIFERVRLGTLFLWTFAAAVIRWLMIGYLYARPQALIIAQVLHAATFGLYHAAAVQIAFHFFPGTYRTRGQALYGTAAGAGGAIGSLGSGYLWRHLGPAHTFAAAAGLDVIGFLIVWYVLRRAISFSPDCESAQTKSRC
ncbi:MAG: MFS transporter [Acidiferrobacteraceae bacterium]